jgi:negative regulator of replication initiation
MRTVRISEEVWNEIAKRGKFGETPDDVLRRVFSLTAPIQPGSFISKKTRSRYATQRMSARVSNEMLYVEFLGGLSNKWQLPPKDNKAAISKVRKLAVEFAENSGASLGQVHAVVKAMTDAGYHITK